MLPTTGMNDHERLLVKITSERIDHVSGATLPSHSPGNCTGWTSMRFKQNLHARINSLTSSTIDFDLLGIDASVANAFRRIIIAEIPTVAVEAVYIFNNTSLIQDEVLAQRLGLVPLAIDPHKVEYKAAPDAAPTDMDTIVFNFVAECRRKPNVAKDEHDPSKIWEDAEVYSSRFEYDEKGAQSASFPANAKPRAVESDILIAKLRGGQGIVAELHCIKGEGKDHAKWSPVATATYRLLPSIHIKSPIPLGLLSKFQACFSSGVIDISSGVAKVQNARKDTVSREVLRHAEFSESVELGRVRDHFIFTLESAGQYPPQTLVPEAGGVLLGKIRKLRRCLPKSLST